MDAPPLQFLIGEILDNEPAAWTEGAPPVEEI
jgi:hypothetical protein